MAHGTKIGGTNYGISGGKCRVNGTNYSIKKGRTLVGGTGYDILFTNTLANYKEGSIVYINENGVAVPFYVAKHNYESGLNGKGRTLLVRKYILEEKNVFFNSSYRGSNAYANESNTASYDGWLNITYKALLDATVQTALGTTKFYYTPGRYDMTVQTLQRGIFHLSMTELGCTSTYCNVEGTALPIANTLKMGKKYTYQESASAQGTRTPQTNNTTGCYVINANGTVGLTAANSALTSYLRPAFTLPEDAVFDPNTDGFISA